MHKTEILKVSNKTINNILDILSQQDARIKQLEISTGNASKTKDHLVTRLEKSLANFDENLTIEGLKKIIEDLSAYVAWNSNRITRLESRLRPGRR